MNIFLHQATFAWIGWIAKINKGVGAFFYVHMDKG